MEFAFLVHPRNVQDFYAHKPLARLLPKGLLKLVVNRLNPICLNKIEVKVGDKMLTGALISLTQMPEYILNHNVQVGRKIEKALQLAQVMGAKLIGLGAFTSPVTHGGLDLLNKYDIRVTNGNAYTTAIVVYDIKKICDIIIAYKEKIIIAIVGATGSIGSAVSKILSANYNLLLIGRDAEKLTKLKAEVLSNNNPHFHIQVSTDINAIKNANIVILVTSHKDVLIDLMLPTRGSIIYDITQPSNLSRRFNKEREDILVIKGGLAKVFGINAKIDFGLPAHVYFGCLCETILLSLEKKYTNFSVGYVTIDKVLEITNIAQKYNFESGWYIENNFLNVKNEVTEFCRKTIPK